jgi:hypothetical protein
VVDHFPSMPKVLGLVPNITKRENRTWHLSRRLQMPPTYLRLLHFSIQTMIQYSLPTGKVEEGTGDRSQSPRRKESAESAGQPGPLHSGGEGGRGQGNGQGRLALLTGLGLNLCGTQAVPCSSLPHVSSGKWQSSHIHLQQAIPPVSLPNILHCI